MRLPATSTLLTENNVSTAATAYHMVRFPGLEDPGGGQRSRTSVECALLRWGSTRQA